MRYSVERLDGEAILVFSLGKDFRVQRDSASAREELASALDALGAEAYMVTDFSGAALSFTDLVIRLRDETRGLPGSLSDPRIRRNIFIGSDDMVDLAAESLRQTQYGKVDVMIFRDVPTAVEFLRAVIQQ